MEIHHVYPFFRGIDWDLSLLFVPGKLMNIVLDVAQGVLGDFSDLLFFTEFFGGFQSLVGTQKKLDASWTIRK